MPTETTLYSQFARDIIVRADARFGERLVRSVPANDNVSFDKSPNASIKMQMKDMASVKGAQDASDHELSASFHKLNTHGVVVVFNGAILRGKEYKVQLNQAIVVTNEEKHSDIVVSNVRYEDGHDKNFVAFTLNSLAEDRLKQHSEFVLDTIDTFVESLELPTPGRQ